MAEAPTPRADAIPRRTTGSMDNGSLYGHAAARSVRGRGRAEELLPGRRAARRDAAGGEPADRRARAPARRAAPRPLGPTRRADRGRPAALPQRAARARGRGAAP